MATDMLCPHCSGRMLDPVSVRDVRYWRTTETTHCPKCLGVSLRNPDGEPADWSLQFFSGRAR
jgi:Zn-finger nucleic acid-binding protein